MNSKLYDGFVEHERFVPTGHRLNYPVHVWALDLDELETLDQRLPLFGYNRKRPVALYDGDYLMAGPGSIRQKLMEQVAPYVSVEAIERIVMVTSPRWLGYVFNPVSFYYCFDTGERLLAAVAEVNNTFGEKHVYVLPQTNGNGFPARFQADKAFHVSPFNTMGGSYDFHFGDIRKELDVRIDLHRDGDHILRAQLQGSGRPLTAGSLLKMALRHPIRPHLTIPRIYREAYKLFFRRKLDYHDKPVPHSPMTLRRLAPTAGLRYCMRLLLGTLDKAEFGRLDVTLPDGSRRFFGNGQESSAARMHINDYRFFSRVVFGGDIGLGESFVDKEWETEDIAAVLGFFIRNRNRLEDGNFWQAAGARLLERIRYWSRSNTIGGSRKNIRAHYDLSNEFFGTFLDETMAYSCAIFNRPDDSLQTAQTNKFSRIIHKLRLQPTDHLLEIGCGWGGFAIEAVRQTGCRVTGITISKEQYALARQRVRQAGLQERITIELRDYRKMTGRFDKIVSIEMLEAVGHEYFGTYFRQLDKLLGPDGIAVVQTISIGDQRYDAYRKSHDWIQKHIFPGGLVPSLTALTQAMTRHSQLAVDHVENIGNHYATTLAHWHRRFLANRDQVSELGFDRTFQRKWAYYLKICEAGFRHRVLGNLQLVLTREGNANLMEA